MKANQTENNTNPAEEIAIVFDGRSIPLRFDNDFCLRLMFSGVLDVAQIIPHPAHDATAFLRTLACIVGERVDTGDVDACRAFLARFGNIYVTMGNVIRAMKRDGLLQIPDSHGKASPESIDIAKKN